MGCNPSVLKTWAFTITVWHAVAAARLIEPHNSAAYIGSGLDTSMCVAAAAQGDANPYSTE
jgi:hypothetical protein